MSDTLSKLTDIRDTLQYVEAVDLPDLLDTGVVEPVIQIAHVLDDLESIVFRLTRMVLNVRPT